MMPQGESHSWQTVYFTVCLCVKGHSSPCLKAGAFWPQKGNLIRRREHALHVVVRLVVRFSQAPLHGAGRARHAIVHTGVPTG
jgi:hypothetical protein